MTALEDDKAAFVALCNELKDCILDDLKNVHHMPQAALDWIHDMIDYNCKGGKMNRGLSVVDGARALAKGTGRDLSEEELKKARILGWCIEWLQAFFLVADDVMDESITRRGQPCWYRVPKVKQIAINDAFLLQAFVFQLLRKFFSSQAYYMDIVELFQEVIYQTELGQLLDLTSQPMDAPIDLDRFTSERYRQIVVYKTAFYTFYLPAACAMHLNGIADHKCYQIAKDVCIQMGEYFQVQDDYLDCYGDPEVIGKVGTDIQDNKCSWLVVQALSRVSPEQREVLKLHYGKAAVDSISTVKALYHELKLKDAYEEFEATSYAAIVKQIDVLGDHERLGNMFLALVRKIYKRSK